jgi:hypothetical protein
VNRLTSALPEHPEEVCLGDPRLTEHLVEQARRDVASHLMAQAYLEDLPARQGLLPRLVLLARKPARRRTTRNSP